MGGYRHFVRAWRSRNMIGATPASARLDYDNAATSGNAYTDGMCQNAILFLYCRPWSKLNVSEYRRSSSWGMIYSKSYAISRPGSIQGAPRPIRRRGAYSRLPFLKAAEALRRVRATVVGTTGNRISSALDLGGFLQDRMLYRCDPVHGAAVPVSVKAPCRTQTTSGMTECG
jgi:hypothetical protein